MIVNKYKPNLDTNIAQRAMEAISGNEEISTKEPEIKPFPQRGIYFWRKREGKFERKA